MVREAFSVHNALEAQQQGPAREAGCGESPGEHGKYSLGQQPQLSAAPACSLTGHKRAVGGHFLPVPTRPGRRDHGLSQHGRTCTTRRLDRQSSVWQIGWACPPWSPAELCFRRDCGVGMATEAGGSSERVAAGSPCSSGWDLSSTGDDEAMVGAEVIGLGDREAPMVLSH